KKVLMALSGGVDSSVAALLLARQGYELVGITMRLADAPPEEARGPRSCCSVEDVSDARAVAERLGIPFYAGHYKDEFESHVIGYFVESYRKGLTPNPCARCNEHLKFGGLLRRAEELGCDFLATGHYARIGREGNEPRLLRARDPEKDQSYFLFGLREEDLSRILFPLGDLAKSQVREIAREAGLPVAEKPDSQEICFVPDSGYVRFVEKRGGAGTPGKMVKEDGRAVGEHQGLHAYTVGQRRGLGLSGNEDPLYVLRLDPAKNEIVVGPEERLLTRKMRVGSARLSSRLPGSFRAEVRIRHRHAAAPARVERLEGNAALVAFDEPQRAATPGQAAVFYDGDMVLGGGWIEEAFSA
ncbi:MAG: tRNA 2-thiouridine(34) synthase MnmA, partial [Bdellovibrionota bacterium]